MPIAILAFRQRSDKDASPVGFSREDVILSDLLWDMGLRYFFNRNNEFYSHIHFLIAEKLLRIQFVPIGQKFLPE